MFSYAAILTRPRQVLRFFGIKYVEINGSKPASVRSKVLDEFRNSTRDGPRVCLLSNVGLTGLNIPQANIVIGLVSDTSREPAGSGAV